MGGGLVGDEIEVLAARSELRDYLGGVPEQPDRQGSAGRGGATNSRQRVVQRFGRLVEIAGLDPALDPGGVDLDAEDCRACHRRGERLGATHPAKPGGEDGPPAEVRRAEVLLAGRGERLVRALQDPLGADVDPAPRGHLPEHRQAESLEPAELVPGRPARDEQRVRDQDARRPWMGAENADGLSALHEQRLVLAEGEERPDERLQRVVVARCLARAAVDDQLLGLLRHLAVEVVEEHPKRRLRLPRAGVQRLSARRADGAQIAAELLDDRIDLTHAHASSPTSVSTAATSSPARIASATRSMSGASVRSSMTVGESERTKSCAARAPAPGSSGARNSTP